MEGAYWVAWIVLYAFGIGLIALCVYPLRRHFYVAFFVGVNGVFWMLVPIPFTDENSAPLFVVLAFQLFFDPEASYAFSAAAALVGSAIILAATFALYAFNTAFHRVSLFTRRQRYAEHGDANDNKGTSEAANHKATDKHE